MRKFLLPVLLSLTLTFCFEACKPEKIPEKPGQETPTPEV